MKTLVQINSGLGFGSVGRIADQIGELSEKHGWICYYAHGTRYKTHECKTAIPVGGKLTDYIHYAISLLTGRDGIGSYFATKRLVRRLRDIKPDIVHLHNIHGSYLNYKVLFDYLAKANIPVVWTLHDCWAATGHCAYFDSVNCEKWKTGCYDCQLRLDYPKSLLFDCSSWNHRRKISSINSIQNLTLVHNPIRLDNMAQAGYYTILNTWSPTNAANNLIKLIDNLQGRSSEEITYGPCSKAYPF